ncbi:hypothetical protein ACFX14_047418 [Malus domestica]
MQLQFLAGLLFLSTHPATPLNFNFPSFPNETNSSNSPVAELRTIARVETSAEPYYKPFLLRQRATGKLADFTTNFTFNNQSDINDPVGEHVGIDINSVMSKITMPWNGSIVDGKINSARVNYDSTAKNLSVAFPSYVNGIQVMRYLDYSVNGIQVMRYLDYSVNVNDYLRDRVIAGFSAATGDNMLPCTGSFSPLHKGTRENSDEEDAMVCNLIDDEFGNGTRPRKFSYGELARATSDFLEEEKLGEGGFGGV